MTPKSVYTKRERKIVRLYRKWKTWEPRHKRRLRFLQQAQANLMRDQRKSEVIAIDKILEEAMRVSKEAARLIENSETRISKGGK